LASLIFFFATLLKVLSKDFYRALSIEQLKEPLFILKFIGVKMEKKHY